MQVSVQQLTCDNGALLGAERIANRRAITKFLYQKSLCDIAFNNSRHREFGCTMGAVTQSGAMHLSYRGRSKRFTLEIDNNAFIVLPKALSISAIAKSELNAGTWFSRFSNSFWEPTG